MIGTVLALPCDSKYDDELRCVQCGFRLMGNMRHKSESCKRKDKVGNLLQTCDAGKNHQISRKVLWTGKIDSAQ